MTLCCFPLDSALFSRAVSSSLSRGLTVSISLLGSSVFTSRSCQLWVAAHRHACSHLRMGIHFQLHLVNAKEYNLLGHVIRKKFTFYKKLPNCLPRWPRRLTFSLWRPRPCCCLFWSGLGVVRVLRSGHPEMCRTVVLHLFTLHVLTAESEGLHFVYLDVMEKPLVRCL